MGNDENVPPLHDRAWGTAAGWFAGGRRAWYDPAAGGVLTESLTLGGLPPGHRQAGTRRPRSRRPAARHGVSLRAPATDSSTHHAEGTPS